MRKLRFIPGIFLLLLLPFAGPTQPASFSHITIDQGLSANNIRSLAVDKNGFLWIGTNEGLNVYDGYSAIAYLKKDHPEMASNLILHLFNDSQNNIWVGTPEGITRIDAQRRLNRIILPDTISRFGCRSVLETKSNGVILVTSLGHFYRDKKNGQWKKLDWIPSQLPYNRFTDAALFSDDKIIYSTDSVVMILDYEKRKVVFEHPFRNVSSVCRVNENQIAVGILDGMIHIIDIRTKKIVREHRLTNVWEGKLVNTTLNELRPLPGGHQLIAAAHSGLFIIDSSGKITIYRHDPINLRSIASDINIRVEISEEGEVIVGTSFSGVSIFNIHNKSAGHTRLFKDEKGRFYDNYLADVAEDSKGIIWIGAFETIIRWDRKKNHTKFYYHYSSGKDDIRSLEIRSMCIDKQDRVWAGSLGDGLSILNQSTGQYEKIPLDTSLSPALKQKVITGLMTASDGMIWVGTAEGIYTIDPADFSINAFMDHPQLIKMSGKRVNVFFEDEQRRIWLGSQFEGVFCYDPATQSLRQYSKENGLAANQCFGMVEDRKHNIYVATSNGFSLISPEGKIKSYTRANGLKYDRIDGILEDEEGNIWMPNERCLAKFSPAKQTIESFDHHAGLTTDYYRPGCFLMTSEGELLLGSRVGMYYFFPSQLVYHPPRLKVNIYQADLEDTTRYLGAYDDLALRYAANNVLFRFAAVNLLGSQHIRYQFKLEGYDKDWQSGVDLREARYSSLPPGNYKFKVRASTDGNNWTDANNTVAVSINPPLWQKWWFRAGLALLIIGIVFFMVRSRDKKLKLQREKLETEQAINYFASSLYAQQSVDSILWDVARNCIGRLEFEDCVIYLLDEEKNLLVQKAAYGPKSPKQFEIDQPIGIKPGEGIVGHVALSGKAEIIPDTTNDPRYIVDDKHRLSEISVPILYDGKVLGVIDCEHSKKRFFTQKHLSVLTTIASLCANKIVRARAEEEKQKAQGKLMETQQKMTEVEMQALRAQMNPHFIFNSLNSINRYIVKSDQATASLYLTRFARLIRLILDNSNSKTVSLSNELEALKLYIEMEALRFDKKFEYRINVDPSVNPESVKLPPLIIQPYVENAIWHGLLHKETPGCLSISVNMPEENMLECIIEDDGVGRQKAKELKSKTATTRKSLGMELTANRLTLLNKYAELNASIDIIDLEGELREATGTKVILKIPV